MFQVIGMREEYYIGNVFYSVEMYKPEQLKRYIISVIYNNKKYEVELRIDNSVCINGWSIVSYGIMRVCPVLNFNITYELNENFDGIVDKELPLRDIYRFMCTYFSVSYNGMTLFYSEGYTFVNKECFIKTPRQKELRPVFLMYGEYPISFSNDFQEIKNFPQKDLTKQILIFKTESVFYLVPFIEKTKEYIIGNNEYIYVNFHLLHRGKNNYVWILYGNSNLGKTYLTRNLKNTIYIKDLLPETITETYIIIKNNEINLNDVVKRINPIKTIIGVHFSIEFPTKFLYQKKQELINEINSEVAYRPLKRGYYEALNNFNLNCIKQNNLNIVYDIK